MIYSLMLRRLRLIGRNLATSASNGNQLNHVAGVVRIVELCRPSALHAINTEMVNAITDALQKWQDNPNCRYVVLKADNSAGMTKTKAFCAGGDIVAIVNDQLEVKEKHEFFKREYQLNHLIGTYKKPVISILDGITMGGGAGLSVHGQYRISTESTLFAMPETAIGFFPDVGASFFLSRLPFHLGLYLALTGHRLVGADNYRMGISTHHVPSTRVEDVICSLQNLHGGVTNLSAYLDQFSDGQLDPPSSLDPHHIPLIERHFSKGSLAEIHRSLERDCDNAGSSVEQDWSKKTLAVMKTMSPTSQAVTFALLEKGRKMSFKRCLRTEYTLARNFITRVPDMKQGITTKLIKKEKSVTWTPASISEVDPKFIESLFDAASYENNNALSFYNEIDYEHYPHNHALPTLPTIKHMVQEATGFRDQQELIDFICRQYNEKEHLRPWLNELFQLHVQVTSPSSNHDRTVKFTWAQ